MSRTALAVPVLAAALALAAPAAAVGTVYSIEMTNVLGVFSFVDPAGFSCVTGSAPFHNPPGSIERRCTATFATASCGDLAATGKLEGLTGASLQVNAQCSDGFPMPPFAGCSATVPLFGLTASCANTPPPQTTTRAFEFVCHAPASGAWVRYYAKCDATVS